MMERHILMWILLVLKLEIYFNFLPTLHDRMKSLNSTEGSLV